MILSSSGPALEAVSAPAGFQKKGYKVAVLEMGKRWKPEDFPKTNWNLKRYFWAPLFRCFGFFPLSLFRHAWVLSGVGVGAVP